MDKEKQLMELAWPLIVLALGLMLVMGTFGLSALGMAGSIVGWLLTIVGGFAFFMQLPKLFK